MTSSLDGNTLRVLCPGCRKEIHYSTDNPWRPFCSERCRNADLGAWATEKFRVAVVPPEDDDDSKNLHPPP